MRGSLVRDQYTAVVLLLLYYCCCTGPFFFLVVVPIGIYILYIACMYFEFARFTFLLRTLLLPSPDCLAPSRHISMGVGVAAEPRRVAFTSCFGRDMVHPASHTWRLHKYQYLHAYFLGVWRLALDLTQGSDQRCGVGGQVDGGTRRGGAPHACRSDGSRSSAEGRRISGECLCDAADRPGR